MSTPEPFYITRIDSNLMHLIPGAELFSVSGPVTDMRFCSYARNMFDLYKDAHAFLLEVAKRHLETEAFEMGLEEIDEVDLVELNRLCQVRFTLLERITDPDEIKALARAVNLQRALEQYPRDQDAPRHAQDIRIHLKKHLTGQPKDFPQLRMLCTIAEIALTSLSRNEA